MTTTAANRLRFTLDEEALRAAFEEEEWILPFAPLSIDADELHHLLLQCQDRGIIRPPSSRAALAVYPLSIAGDREPQLAVDPGLGGPLLLGTSVEFRNGLVPNVIEGSLAVIIDLVEKANRILEEASRSYQGALAL